MSIFNQDWMGNMLLIHMKDSPADGHEKTQVSLSQSRTRLMDLLANYFSSSSHFSLIYLLLKDMESFPYLHRS